MSKEQRTFTGINNYEVDTLGEGDGTPARFLRVNGSMESVAFSQIIVTERDRKLVTLMSPKGSFKYYPDVGSLRNIVDGETKVRHYSEGVMLKGQNQWVGVDLLRPLSITSVIVVY